MTVEKKKSFYGWPLCMVLAIMYFCSSGSILAAAQIVNPLMLADESMVFSGTLLSLGFTIFVIMQGIPSPFVGQLIAKIGARFTMAIGAALLAIGALSMIFIVTEPIGYLISFGICTSVGSIMAGQISVQSTVGQWFSLRRGVAMTLVMALGGLASFATPLMVNALVRAFDGAWQAGWYLIAFYGIILIPIALIFVRNKPSDLNQLPDGAEDEEAFEQKQETSKVFKNSDKVEFREAIRKPQFWFIALTGTGAFCAASLVSSQGVLHFTTIGFSLDVIVGAVATMGIAALVGKLIIGLLSDIVEPLRLMSFSILAIALVTFISANIQTGNPEMMYIFYIVYGVGVGAGTTVLPTTVANYFGPHAFSKNLGTTMLVTTVVSSGIPLLGGIILDATNSCSLTFTGTAIVMAICALMGFLVRIPRNSKEKVPDR